jgi:hypothetical protein
MNFPQNKPHYLIVKIPPVNFVNEVACVLYLWLLRLFCLGKLGRNEVVFSGEWIVESFAMRNHKCFGNNSAIPLAKLFTINIPAVKTAGYIGNAPLGHS